MKFVWDPNKAASNRKKHGVSFEEAVTVFSDPLAQTYQDLVHEDRAILVGHSEERRVLFVAYAEIATDYIRIISARRATTHERRRHEEGE